MGRLYDKVFLHYMSAAQVYRPSDPHVNCSNTVARVLSHFLEPFREG
jgi:hypothetical protein